MFLKLASLKHNMYLCNVKSNVAGLMERNFIAKIGFHLANIIATNPC